MGRRAEGWSLELNSSGYWRVRFTHNGRRRQVSTGARDRSEAERVAKQIYAEVVTGRAPSGPGSLAAREEIAVLAAEWLAQTEHEHTPHTGYIYAIHARRWVAEFRTLDRIDQASVQLFTRKRLGLVLRTTVHKELAALRVFLRWCNDRGMNALDPKLVVAPRRGILGTRSDRREQKPGPIAMTEAEGWALIDRLPEGRIRWRAIVLFETGLRPSTVEKLRAPQHYQRGAAALRISDDIDKARYGRTLPLSPAAREALDAVCPEAGVLFGTYFQMHLHMRAAATSLGWSPLRRRWLSSYDFRHSRLTIWGEGGVLPAVSFLAGHKHATTTSKYMHASHEAARALVLAQKRPKKNPKGGKKWPRKPTKPKRRT